MRTILCYRQPKLLSGKAILFFRAFFIYKAQTQERQLFKAHLHTAVSICL